MSTYSLGFEIAYEGTMENEGFGELTNHKFDPGQQTWSGISRRYHRSWPGWDLIDSGLHLNPDGRRKLFALQKEFYYHEFWRPIDGENLAFIHLDISTKVFDVAVHRSVETGSEYLQRTLNVLNYGAKIYPNLRVDGHIGPRTIAALLTCVKYHEIRTIINWIRVMHGADMVNFMEGSEDRESLPGLANRSLY